MLRWCLLLSRNTTHQTPNSWDCTEPLRFPLGQMTMLMSKRRNGVSGDVRNRTTNITSQFPTEGSQFCTQIALIANASHHHPLLFVYKQSINSRVFPIGKRYLQESATSSVSFCAHSSWSPRTGDSCLAAKPRESDGAMEIGHQRDGGKGAAGRNGRES